MIKRLSNLPGWKQSLVLFCAGLLAFFLVIFVLGRLAAWGECSWYGYQTARDTRYAAFVGCMVQLDDKWYPRNELRITQ